MTRKQSTDIAPSQVAAGRPVRCGELFGFYLPLAIQAASQSLTYPLVASIASHGAGGPLNLAGMAQAMSVMSLLSMLGAGLLTTGMVYGTTRAGFARFRQVNGLITVLVLALMALVSIPPVAHLWYGGVLGLPASIEKPAYQALVASMMLQLLFFLRNPYQVVLYIHGATALASIATLSRIVGTVLLVPVFIFFGLVGPVWAVAAQAVAVACEVILSWYFARPFLRALPVTDEAPPTHRAMIAFNLPLSAGGFFLNVSGVMISWAIVRAPAPEQMMPAYYLAAGLAGPAAFAASRMQTVVLALLPRVRSERMLQGFTLLVGVLMGGLPLLFILPGISEVYYVAVQRCPDALLPLVRWSALGLLFHPLTMAIRGYLEGKAAYLKQPVAIMTGHAVYFAALTAVALASLALRVPGNVLPALAFFAANLAAAGTMYGVMAWRRGREAVQPE